MAYTAKSEALMFLARPRPAWILSGLLAVAGIGLAVAGCAVTPLGQAPGPKATTQAVPAGPPARILMLGSPIILQVMKSQSPSAGGRCSAGLEEVQLPPGAAPMSCFRPVGSAITLTSAAVSPVAAHQPPPPRGQPRQPVSYGFTVVVPPAQVTAVTALIRSAYDSHDAVGISVDGKLWEAPQVDTPFSGQQFQVSMLSMNQALQLYRLLVPPGRD